MRMPFDPSALRALAATLLFATLTACGPQCQTLQAERDAFMTQATSGPPRSPASHVRLALPMRTLTRAADAAFDQLAPARFDLPGLGDLGRYLPTELGIVPRKVALALDKGDAARIALDFDVKHGRRALFGMALAAKAPVTYDRARGKMRFSIRADLFETVKPRLDANATDALTDSLFDALPGPARLLVSRADVARIARRAVEYLGEQAYDLLRREVLAGVGEIASFSIDFPDVPLAGLALTSIGGADGFLRLDARLDLPIERGLPDDDAELTRAMNEISRGQTPAESEQVEIAVATSAVMALANWGLVKGKLPARYTDKGVASSEGRYQVGAAWEPGERPLKVNLWSLDTPGLCLHALAGAQPEVAWEKGKLQVGVTQSRIEKLSGPPLLQLAVQLTGITEGLFDFTKSITTQTKIEVGGADWKLGLQSVRLDGQIFRLRMKATTPKVARPARKAS